MRYYANMMWFFWSMGKTLRTPGLIKIIYSAYFHHLILNSPHILYITIHGDEREKKESFDLQKKIDYSTRSKGLRWGKQEHPNQGLISYFSVSIKLSIIIFRGEIKRFLLSCENMRSEINLNPARFGWWKIHRNFKRFWFIPERPMSKWSICVLFFLGGGCWKKNIGCIFIIFRFRK